MVHSQLRPVFRGWVSLLFLPCIGASTVAAQSDTLVAAPWHETMVHDGMAVLRIGAHLGTSPLRWEGRDWLFLGLTTTATGGAALLDDEALRLMHSNQSSGLTHAADLSEMFGDSRVLLVATSTAYLAGLFLEQRWTRETALLAGTAALYSTLLTRVVKPIVGRARPYMGLGSTNFQPISLKDDFNSFPSGHTVVAFSVATVLARRVDNTFASVGFYALATCTALSRIYADQHWFSDVVFGGIVSTLLAHSVVDWYEEEVEAGAHTGFRITPLGNGLQVAWVF